MADFSDKLSVDIEVNSEKAYEQLGTLERMFNALEKAINRLSPTVDRVEETLDKLSQGMSDVMPPDKARGIFEPFVRGLDQLSKEYSAVLDKMGAEWEEFTETGIIPKNIEKFAPALQKQFLEFSEKYAALVKQLDANLRKAGVSDNFAQNFLTNFEKNDTKAAFEKGIRQILPQGGLFSEILDALVNDAEGAIPTEIARKIFEPLAQETAAFKEKYADLLEKMNDQFREFSKTGIIPESLSKFSAEMQKQFLEAAEKYAELREKFKKDVGGAGYIRFANDQTSEFLEGFNSKDSKKDRENRTKELAKALQQREGLISRHVRKLLALAAPLVGLFSIKKLFGDYTRNADELGKLSHYVQMNISDLYTWSKANEAAGGSASAFQSALQNWVQTTHRSAEDFIKLGQRMHGMTEAERMYFLKIHGLSRESMMVFSQSADKADELVKKIKETALTEEDYENARKFRQQWSLVGIAVESVGTKLARVFLPVITKVAAFAENVARFIAQHSRVIVNFFTVLSAVLGGMFIVNIGKAIKSAEGLIAVLRMLGIAFVATPMGAFIAGLMAAVAAVALLMDDLQGFVNGEISGLGQVLELGGMTTEEIDELRNALKKVIDLFGQLWDAVKPLFGMLLTGFAKAFVFVLEVIGGWLTFIVRTFNFIKNLVTEIVDFVKNIDLGEIGNAVVGFFTRRYQGDNPDDPSANPAAPVVANTASRNNQITQDNRQDISVVVNGNVDDGAAMGAALGDKVNRASTAIPVAAYSSMNSGF